MGKQFRLRLSRKSNRDLNPVEKWRRKQKDNQKLRRIVSRLSQDPRPSQRPRHHQEEVGAQDPMLGELLTTTQLRDREETSSDESLHSPQNAPLPKQTPEVKSIELIPTSVLLPRTVPSQTAPSPSDSDEDLDFLGLSTFETQVAKPTAQTSIVSKQAQFQSMLEDPDMADFYKTVGDLL